MKLSKHTAFLWAVIGQLLIILLLVVFKLSVVTSGATVFLRIVPVDPNDPFRGDYVTVRYDISSIPAWRFRGRMPQRGEPVYVSLRKDGSYHSIDSASTERPEAGLFLRGVVEREASSFSSSQSVGVLYGIEEYFIPEGTGRTFRFGDHEVMGEVAVGEDGHGVARQLYVDGTRWP